MTKNQAVTYFMQNILPKIKNKYESDGVRDMPARREAWNNYTDVLCKDGEITILQYEKWTHPKCNQD